MVTGRLTHVFKDRFVISHVTIDGEEIFPIKPVRIKRAHIEKKANSLENSNAILALRCALYNGTLDRVFPQSRDSLERPP